MIGDIGDIVGPGLGTDGNLSAANGESRTASEAISKGQLMRIDDTGKWVVGNVDTYENATVVAIATDSASAGENLLGIYIGKVSVPSTTTDSKALFLSSTGYPIETATTIVGEYVTRIGKGLFQDTVYVQCEEPVEVA